jgi:hypothetical protein
VRVVLDVPERVTFLLDRQGKVAKVYPKVDPGVHAEQVLADAAALPPLRAAVTAESNGKERARRGAAARRRPRPRTRAKGGT